ncbi:response regulator transcription factor FixJ [Hymenobacter roseosalivarius]|uniref:hypothetical protein n=1 Tax=Hymenobacter roseosalivarius TaxID=89967 RepID=UPI001179C609|nr:hypothetical protein [Hymenobacter roseosalivarius]
MNYKSFTKPYLGSLGPFGDVIVSMLAKKKAAGIQLGAPIKSVAVIALAQGLKGEGKSNGAIARALGISPSTVAKYVASTC